ATGVWGQLISGWQWNGIVQAQAGFPTTPRVGSNRSGSGDTRSPDAPDRNPNFTGDIVLGTVARWYDPTAFSLPIPGTFGNGGRGVFKGPKLFNLDMSLFKKIRISERYNLQFRAEAFNIFNHPNFGIPNSSVFSGSNYAPAAGRITSTATRPRNLQFALRFTF
ncbi:MAG: carboxypeptidase regulatory-like domain-containing protein, partial [Acidobacteria bacterium]|nr:carboxypeptidase regulatory-like domain-containing protein [Acidobacteriota bacterium]